MSVAVVVLAADRGIPPIKHQTPSARHRFERIIEEVIELSRVQIASIESTSIGDHLRDGCQQLGFIDRF